MIKQIMSVIVTFLIPVFIWIIALFVWTIIGNLRFPGDNQTLVMGGLFLLMAIVISSVVIDIVSIVLDSLKLRHKAHEHHTQ